MKSLPGANTEKESFEYFGKFSSNLCRVYAAAEALLFKGAVLNISSVISKLFCQLELSFQFLNFSQLRLVNVVEILKPRGCSL